jgi:uncharacterized repeat protein (TIGR03803 family)
MRICQTLFHAALLGTTFAVAAVAPATAASQPDSQKRENAANGIRRQVSGTAIRSVPVDQHSGFTVMHNFGGPPSDGANSGAEVTLDKSGNIYGTTDYGGAYGSIGYGTIFEIAKGGTESLVHSFGSGSDGMNPDGAVTITSSGDMYGTTIGGGTGGNGVIYELAADGTYSVLHSFATNEGSFLRGRLVQDKKGNFYGTALFGGADTDGTVFEYTTKGKLKVLHTFDSNDGAFPEHGVVMDKDGNLYGVTAYGGTSDNGSIYEVAKDGTFTSLYSFTGGADGSFLYGSLAIDQDGNLYGNAENGGANSYGTVFKLAPNGTLTVLYNFTNGADGGFPEGDTLLMGKGLYSTTTTGGANGQGGVYEVTLTGKEKTLADFSNTNGNYYSAGVTPSGKMFYGTAEYGGPNDNGTVFSLKNK